MESALLDTESRLRERTRRVRRSLGTRWSDGGLASSKTRIIARFRGGGGGRKTGRREKGAGPSAKG